MRPAWKFGCQSPDGNRGRAATAPCSYFRRTPPRCSRCRDRSSILFQAQPRVKSFGEQYRIDEGFRIRRRIRQDCFLVVWGAQ
jgi:hypothetical protein